MTATPSATPDREVFEMMRHPEWTRNVAETFAWMICHPEMEIKPAFAAKARLAFAAIGDAATRELFATAHAELAAFQAA